ncbi:MAG: cell division protein PerM [Nocardioidaceae bacterium]
MTDLLQRAGARAAGRTGDGPPRPIAVSALAVSASVAVAGLIVAFGLALIAWLLGSQGSTADALRAGAAGWLAGHGSGLSVSGAAVDAAPLGLVLVLATAFFTLARRLGAASSLTRARDVVVFCSVAGASYAAVLAAVALLSATAAVAADPWRSAISGFVLAAVFGGLGVMRQSGLLAAGCDRLPWWVRGCARGAGAAIAVLLATASALFVGLLLADSATFGRLWSGLAPGVVGGAGLALLCVVLAPNLVLWAVAVLLGPGFTVGADTSVSLTEVSLGRLPGLPLLAALPSPGPLPGWVVALAAAPVLAGIVAGYVTCAGAPGGGWLADTGLGAAAGAVAGLVTGLLVAVSGGAVGPGRMAEVGPDVLLCVGAAVLSLGAGGASGGLLGHYRGARAHDRAE